MNLLTQTAVIVRPGTTTDRYENTVPDWSTATRTTVKAWIAQQVRGENTDRRDAMLSTWVGFFEKTVSISGGDRVEWESETFEVDGPPWLAPTPRGVHHYEVTLTRVEG